MCHLPLFPRQQHNDRARFHNQFYVDFLSTGHRIGKHEWRNGARRRGAGQRLFIKVKSDGGKVISVELLNTGTRDKIEKVDNRHKMDSMMVAQYALECPKGFKVEDIPGTKYPR